MMRSANIHIGVLIAASILVAAPARAQAPATQAAATRDDIVSQLGRFESAADLDLPALRQQVLERARTRMRNDPGPVNRPPIAPDLLKLPSFTTAVQFDQDTPIVQPTSYQTLGRIADAMVHASLLPYTFLIVGHIESTGRREANAILSQRRADAVRDVLVNTFKISAKRIAAIGLGEEQLLDPARPAAATNGQLQIVTVAKLPEQSEQPSAVAVPAAKKTAKKR